MTEKNKKIDLDGFPVLRIDQLSYIETEILERAQNEVAELIIKMNEEDNNNNNKKQKSFIYYLNKQLNEMEKEIAKRIAEARVNSLLNDSEDTLKYEFKSKQPILLSIQQSSPRSESSYQNNSFDNNSNNSNNNNSTPIKEKPKFQPIPLPSEIRKQTNITLLQQQQQSPISSRSDNEEHLKHSLSEDRQFLGVINNKSSHNNESTEVKRPKSGQPSRRSVAVVEENFGSSFVVGAIEKRRRFYPKKVVKESDTEIREKNRESRRQLAMKRLLERKQQQIERQEKKKLQQKSENAKNKQKRNSQKSDDQELASVQAVYQNDSDSEESLSGDDKEELCHGELFEASIQHIIVEDEIIIKTDNIHNNQTNQQNQEINIDQNNQIIQQNDNDDNKSNNDSNQNQNQNIVNSFLQSNQNDILMESNQLINEEKSSAALSTLRKLKTKRMKSQEISNELNQIESDIKIISPREEVLSKPQSPDVESSDIDSISSTLNHSVSSQLFQKYFISPSTSIISNIIENDQNVYICSKGPDDLPGLKAWTLISIKSETNDAKWIVNQQFYEELWDECHSTIISHSVTESSSPSSSTSNKSNKSSDHLIRLRLLNQRGKTRRTITYGLVILSKMCESLMLGEIPCESSFGLKKDFEKEFRQLWAERLAQFDSLVCKYNPQEKLFEQVTTCGNMYAVCKKLENLLKTSGLSEKIKEIYESNNSETISEKNIPITQDKSQLLQIEQIEQIITPNSINSTNMINPEIINTSPRNDTNQVVIMNEKLDLTEIKEIIQEHQESNKPEMIEDEELLLNNTQNNNNSNDIVVDDNNDNDNDDDDALLPGSSDIFTKNSQTKLSFNLTSSNSNSNPKLTLTLSTLTSTSTLSSSKQLRNQQQPQQLQLSRQRSTGKILVKNQQQSLSKTNLGIIDNDEKKITNIYKSFAEIFPAVNSLLRIIQKSGCKNGDHENIARTLIECMTIQLKLYEEWFDIMDDYATVFCHDRDRGIPDLMDEADNNALVYSGGSSALHYRVQSSRTEVSNIITDVLNNIVGNWVELPQGLGLGTSWNLLWSWSKPKVNIKSLIIFQKINHFVDSKQLTRKDLLKKNLSRFTDLNVNGINKYSQFYEIMPKTFLLPNEYTSFVKEYTYIESIKQQQGNNNNNNNGNNSENQNIQNIWIMKPVGLSRGRGISLIDNISSLTYSQNSVLQKYLDSPLCLNGYKFDLRLYILVTSFHPLEAFIYREGFARISTEKYSLDSNNLANKFIHLTNSSIQKHNANGATSDNPLNHGDINESNGSKIPLLGSYGLWNKLEEKGFNIKNIWSDICSLVVKSLLAVDDKIEYQPCCFELFGYDILIDSNLRPWLIEVNSSPSLERGTQLDVRIKNQLINDIMNIVDPIPFNRQNLIKVLKKRQREIQLKTYSISINHSNDNELENDLKMIIGDVIPRQYGEEPLKYGQFERLCPNTKIFTTAQKIKSKLFKELPS